MIPEAILMTAAKPMIDSLISKVIKPKIDQFVEKCKLNYENLLIPKREHFEEYLYRTYKKYSIINTLVFKNEQRLLKDLYIPLTIKKEDHHNNIKKTIKIDQYPIDIINDHNKILITDTAGMGKSTLTKYLFLDVIENGRGIPIYIEMRRLSKDRPILLDIQEQINSLSKTFDHTLLLEFIQTGSFIFFLDGYDEISLEERSIITADVQDFISKASNNVFIMTSRPEQALTSFGDFQIFSINSLSKKEAYELLRKYDKQGSTSKKLIEELKSGKYEMIFEFMKNPLLVSLLFAAFDYKNTIPLKKHIFYRQVYDAYFDSHDLAKGDSYTHKKRSKLDIDDFERILRYIGFRCLKYQKIEFEKDLLLSIIDEAKIFCHDLKFSSSDFFEDILTTVPLFCRDGHLYKWVHKSLQEYFSAQFIYKDSKQDQDAILTALYNSENIDKYINLLDLYYDIDNWGFKKNIILPLCQDFVNYYEENIFSLENIENNHIEYRISYLFLREVYLVKLESKNPILDIKKIKEIAEETYSKNKISCISYFNNEDIYIIHCDKAQRKLIFLLKERTPHLLKTQNLCHNDYNLSISNNDTLYINTHTGEHNIEEYIYINFHLNEIQLNRYYLYYETCKSEVDSILKILKSKENSSDLIDGL